MVRYAKNITDLYQTLADRARILGVLLWELTPEGLPVHTPAEPQALVNWAGSDAVWQRLLALVADRPTDCAEPVELWPGARAWLLPDRARGTPSRVFVAAAFTPAFSAALEATDLLQSPDEVQAAIGILSRQAGSSIPQIHAILRWSLDDLLAQGRHRRTIDSFSEKLAQSYEETRLLYRLARLMNCVSDPLESLKIVCGQVQQVLPFDWIAIRFHAQRTRIRELAGALICSGEPPLDEGSMKRLTDDVLLSRTHDEWTAILEPRSHALARAVGAEVIAEPIAHDDQVVAVLLAGNKRGSDPDVSSDELQFIDGAADFLGIYHENLSRFAEQRAMSMGTLHSLTAAIDAKDPYTCGHSERVSLLTGQMAEAMGLPAGTIEEYRIAGLVHDVGKIGVPDAVLCKSGRLTEAEFALIKRHPEIGHRILKDIPQLSSSLPGVLHHHERWDGKGYPHKLAGEAIPLVARAMALADSFDAMSSNRSYRSALPREAVLAEMHRCAGSQFDASLVGTFLNLDFSEFDLILNAAAGRAAA